MILLFFFISEDLNHFVITTLRLFLFIIKVMFFYLFFFVFLYDE